METSRPWPQGCNSVIVGRIPVPLRRRVPRDRRHVPGRGMAVAVVRPPASAPADAGHDRARDREREDALFDRVHDVRAAAGGRRGPGARGVAHAAAGRRAGDARGGRGGGDDQRAAGVSGEGPGRGGGGCACRARGAGLWAQSPGACYFALRMSRKRTGWTKDDRRGCVAEIQHDKARDASDSDKICSHQQVI